MVAEVVCGGGEGNAHVTGMPVSQGLSFPPFLGVTLLLAVLAIEMGFLGT